MNHLGLSWLNKMNFSKSQAACIGLPAVVNPPQAWRDPLNLDIPFVTVVTDMVSIHPLWICPEVTRCIVPTEIAKVWAIKFGMPAEKVEVCGQPVSLKFAQISGDKQAIRRKLGLDLNRPAVMVMGGGEGFGRIFEIARAVAQTVPQSQLLIVSGRNKGLKARLEAVAWEIPTCVYGFVHNMPELMRAADILITKAGPGTINEAFTVGLPPLICGFIPGQEKGNVAYVEEHQAGVYAETPQEIARLVRDWLDPSNHTLQRMAHNAARLARPDAALAIASRLCNVA
jgi:1,2-diacylglycerol 3-beta-galactosyltransferase